MHEPAEDDLLQQFRNGDVSAFVEYYRRNQADVFTFCLRYCDNDAAVASDAFQETFLRIYEHIGSYRGGNPRAWTLTIARNMCISIFRKRKPLRLEAEHLNIESSDLSLGPEFKYEQETLRASIEHAIGELPLSLREPFLLREFEGLSHAEIAEQLDITVDSARQRIWRARQFLRQLLLPDFLADRGEQ